MSIQVAIDNRTPFCAESLVLPDPHGQEVLLLVVAASFEAPEAGALQLASSSAAIRTADEYRGDPARSSLLYEADVALAKPYVDVLVNGSAHAPSGVEAERVDVELHVADVSKSLKVSGDRDSGGRPCRFARMPIVYERAFGGTAENGEADARNPVGIGFHDARSSDPDVMSSSPNIEAGRASVDGDLTGPAGYGPINRGWTPRRDFAGTYDQQWLEERWPVLPLDFDSRHNQAAPADQQSRTLVGGEPALLLNLTANGCWRFNVPRLDVPVYLLYDDRARAKQLRVDTVLIEPDEYRITLTSRLAIPTVRNQPRLREIVLGHVTRGWLFASTYGKDYLDHKGAGGTDHGRRLFYL
jgi:hypothetical protein